MKFKDFYSCEVEEHILENIDEEYRRNMDILIKKLDQGTWTQKQKKKQKSSILPNIALYKTFLQYGIPKERARELVRKRAYFRAEKAHNVLSKFFRLPKFSKAFRFFMRKGMNGNEFWISEILFDNDEKYVVDITKCLWADTCSYFDCIEICEVFCLSDHIVFGNIDKMDFRRNETLGMGGKKCDFCFIFKNDLDN